MYWLALGAATLAVLVWVGRRPAFLRHPLRLATAASAVLAAAAAVAAGLRGQLVVCLLLIALSAYLANAARASPDAATRAESGMTAAEAHALLGVGPTATRDEIQAAYRRLMTRAHPDQGGSTGLAAQLNAARDRLLR
jgi:DnaJ-domain-containing protein 1